ncbi:MAG: tRNA pseudouridine(55) synthase TruB [Kiritimatiellae bacterium]|nr:tRNA pseudouridine(55) synthase TruB [Kiritimatiellia bacterium]
MRRAGPPAPPRALDPFDGVLPVDKPAGPTSHDIVDLMRRRFRFKKVGHGGTLDPQATGLLVLLLGRGTKLSETFMNADKTYEGHMHLGVATDSQDAQGKVIREGDCSGITRARVEEEMAKFLGDIMQTPPMVSAVKKDGVPLYKLARKGKTVERKPKLIHVYEFDLLEFDPPQVFFRLRCTKGTYVRTICADIGEKLGCGAHLAQLRRMRSGGLHVDDALPVEQLREMTREDLLPRIIPVTEIRRL